MKEEISCRLKYARKELRKISQEDLSKKTGIFLGSISLFETGARKPGLVNLKRLADGLDVTTDFLLSRVDSMEIYKSMRTVLQERILYYDSLLDIAKWNLEEFYKREKPKAVKKTNQ